MGMTSFPSSVIFARRFVRLLRPQPASGGAGSAGTSELLARCRSDGGGEVMRATTAYFAGAGTVIVAITAGVSGGFLFADMVAPKTPKPEMTRLERNMSAEPIRAAAGPSEPVQNSAPPQAS